MPAPTPAITRPIAPGLRARSNSRGVDPLLLRADRHRPCALDVGEHGPNVGVAKLVLKPRHIAPVAGYQGAGADLCHLEQLLVRVMPGVPGRIVRWRGHSAIREPLPPIRLSFQVGPVAGGTPLTVDGVAARDEPGVIR